MGTPLRPELVAARLASPGLLTQPSNGPTDVGIGPVGIGKGLEAPMGLCCAGMLKGTEARQSISVLNRGEAPFAVLARLRIVPLSLFPCRPNRSKHIQGFGNDCGRLSVGNLPPMPA